MAAKESELSFIPPCFRNVDKDCTPNCPSHEENLLAFKANVLKRGVNLEELKEKVRSASPIRKAVVNIRNSTTLPEHLCSNDS